MTTADLAAMGRIGYSYLRVSSVGQAGTDRDGIDRQAAAFPEFCRRHGLTPAPDALVDAGVSAFRGTHRRKGALGRFLDAADFGKVPPGAVLVVEDLDRFSREAPSDALRLLLNDFFESGLALGVTRFDTVIDRGEFNRAGSSSAIQLLVAMGMAHDYSAKLSDRVGSAWERRRREAHAGEKYKAARPFWCDWDDESKDFTLNDHAHIPRRIIALCIDGYGSTHIARMLNDQGLTTTSGGHFTAAWVTRILANRALIGQRVWGGRAKRPDQPVEVMPDFYPAVITKDEWDRSRLAIAERGKNPGRRGRGDHIYNLFQGMIFCTCGGTLTLSRSKRGDRVREYLRCQKREAGVCNSRNGNYTYDEPFLLQLFMRQRWDQFFFAGTGKREAVSHARAAVIAADRSAARTAKEAADARDNLNKVVATSGASVAAMELVAQSVTAAEAAAAADQDALQLANDELRNLQLQPTGTAAQKAIRERVGAFLAEGLDDLAERRRFNVWLSTLGVRVVLTRSASRDVHMIVERPDGLSELQTDDTTFIIDQSDDAVEQEAQWLAGVLGGSVIRPGD
ncbi:recombinase family protein [Synechococcus sp. CS-205]|nr:recombinase family protein [Synechococcus sp. CS-205]